MRTILSFFIVILIMGCSDMQIRKEKAPGMDSQLSGSAEFIVSYKKIIEGLETQNIIPINDLIHPQHGLFIIESSGAMPAMTHVFNIAQWKNSDGKSFFDMGKPGTALPVKEEALPVADCNSPPWFYSKDGCFLQKENTIKDSGIWEYSNLSDIEKEKARDAAGKVEWTVINTRSFKCYFAHIQAKTYLLFIDFRRPCEA